MMTSGLAGKRLVGRYSLDFEVRAEGVGTIYAATDLRRSSMPVIAKVLDVAGASDEEIQRFERSRAILKVLRRQPWLPRLIDRGTEKSLKYLIFENMEGETLAEFLSKLGGLPISSALAIAIDITAVLIELHSRGLMHGDVRTSNIFLEEAPTRIKLLSFDCTLPTDLDALKKAGFSDPRAPSTLEAPYWFPDRLRQPADARYDLYALAVVIYEMVSGKCPNTYPLKDPSLKLVDLVKVDSSIDPGLRDFLTHALNLEISEQFQSAREMSESLKTLQRDRILTPKRPRPTELSRSQRRSSMHPNDVQLVRVYPSESEGRILEKSIPSDTEFEVVVEAKAGVTIHGDGAKYFIQIVVRDLTDFTVVYEDNLKGNLGQEPWSEPVLLHAFPIPAQNPARENHIYEVLASLSAGIRNPNVSFAKSPLFIICRP
jgi:serine/threonine protein kinase